VTAPDTDLRVTKARRTDEAAELHWTPARETVALCGAEDQRRATTAEREVYRAPRCFTCRCLKEEDEED
jgi:hypothetical protein